MPESPSMTSDDLDRASVAVAPNLFDVLFDTDQIAMLCLSNLLSPGLWDTARKIREQADSIDPADSPDLPAAIRLIQRHINRHFTHLHPPEVAAAYGLIDLHGERQRYGAAWLDPVLSQLNAFFAMQAGAGGVHVAVAEAVDAWLRTDRFPNYFYSNHDAVVAHRMLIGSSKKSPNGMTSCLDEAAIFLSLSAIVPRKGEVHSLVVLSSVSHYGAFGYSDDGRRWWFNGKNQLYSQTDWERRVAEQHGGDAQACFDALFGNFSRMTAVAGTFDLQTGESSIPDAYLDMHLRELGAFFGITLRQVQAGLVRRHTAGPESGHATFLRQVLGIESRKELLRRVQADPQPWTDRAWYCYRSLSVPDHRPYLIHARRNPLAMQTARALSSPQEAIDLVAAIPGSRSIFNDPDRIAMPDETLQLRTGTAHDKALLLHVLLEEQARVQHREERVESIFCEEDALVRSQDRWWSMTRFEVCQEPRPGGVRFRF